MAAKPVTAAQECISTHARAKPPHIFMEKLGEFPVVCGDQNKVTNTSGFVPKSNQINTALSENWTQRYDKVVT